MNKARDSESRTRAMIEKPALAVVALGEGQAGTVETETPASREARVRAAAYARYEARGRVHGHDVDDWLAAEATLAGEPAATEATAAPMDR